jgi:serine protease Do
MFTVHSQNHGVFFMKALTKFFVVIFAMMALVVTADESTDLLKSLSKGFSSVAKVASPAVVSVKGIEVAQNHTPNQKDPFNDFGQEFFRRFFGAPQQQQQQQPSKPPTEQEPVVRGTGFIIDPNGYVVTNYHVVKGADNLVVQFNNDEEMDAIFVAADPMADIAVLKVEGSNLPYLEFGDSDQLEVGEWVVAVGSPLEFQTSVTVGVVSAKGRDELALNALEDFIQTDAAINPGSSGGPLLNLDKKVIGINSVIATMGGGYLGISFAIPSNMAKFITQQIIETGAVHHGFIGIIPQQVTKELAQTFDLEKAEGVLIAETLPGLSADEAGLQQGDIIIEYNDIPVKDVKDVTNAIAMMSPGTEVILTIFRDGETLKIPVTVGERPDQNSESASEQGHIEHKLGIEVDELTDELMEQLKYQEKQGIVITKVAPGSRAASVGIRPGALIISVNRQKIDSVPEFYEILEEAYENNNKQILLLVRQGTAMRFITLPIRQ